MSRPLPPAPCPAGRRRPTALAAAALLLLLAAAAGCGGDRGQRSRGGAGPPFEFRALNLRQQDLLGRPTWQLSSPRVRYDLRRRVALVERPQAVIYREGQPAYRLRATSGTLLNDGQVLLLEGGLRLEQLGQAPLRLQAVRARWYPPRNLLELDRRPEALAAQQRLTAQRARFRLDSNHLQLQGQPLLEYWSRAFNPLRQDPPGAAELVVRVGQVDWYPLRGNLRASGPVQARRRPAGRRADLPPAWLSASGLEGNTLQRRFRLQQPVRYGDPVAGSQLTALAVDVDLGADVISSSGAFAARHGALQVQGQGFRLLRGQNLLVIPAGCQLQQAGDSLRADQCRWNWLSQAVIASGQVELRRGRNGQWSRGGWLSGRLGRLGSLSLTNPGGRVLSQVRVPRPAAPAPPPPRPAAEPIRL